MFHYSKTPYFTCTFFTKFTYNEYIGPYFLSHVVLRFSPVISPRMDYMVANKSRCVQHLKKLDVLQEIHDMGHCPWGRTFVHQGQEWPCSKWILRACLCCRHKAWHRVQWLLYNQLQPPKITFNPFELDEYVGNFVLDKPFQIDVSNVKWNQPRSCIQHQPHCHWALYAL